MIKLLGSIFEPALVMVVLLVLLSGCTRMYHVHIWVEGNNNSVVLEVNASVPKEIDVNAEADVSMIP